MIKTRNTITTDWIICTLAAIFYCYEYLLRMEPSVMVTELMHEFQANATELGTLSAFYYFIYTPMQIIVGLLSDLYGPRKILTLAVIACAVGSYIFGIAHTLPIAAIGRLLIGFGSAFAFVTVLKLAASWLPQRFFALFVGLATALGMLGGMVGSIVLSSLVHSIGWQQTITVGTVLGVILTPIVWLIIRDKPETALQENNTPKTKPHYLETFVGLLKILKKPQMWLNGFIACLMYLSLSLFAELWGNSFLANVYHLPTESVATANSMVFLGWLVGGPLIGYISDITCTRRIPISIGCLLSALTISLVIYFPQMNISLLYLLLFLFGIFSSFEVLCFAISRENNPDSLVATASSFTNLLTMAGGIVCQPLVGKILDLFWSGQTHSGDRIYSAIDYQYALTILPLAFLLGFILTFWLKETRNKK
ncbi:Major facilitator family transporter transporter [Gammaproteobacteria bacterium]